MFLQTGNMTVKKLIPANCLQNKACAKLHFIYGRKPSRISKWPAQVKQRLRSRNHTSHLYLCLFLEAKNLLWKKWGRPNNHTKYNTTYKDTLGVQTGACCKTGRIHNGHNTPLGNPRYLHVALKILVPASSSTKLHWPIEELSWSPVGEHLVLQYLHFTKNHWSAVALSGQAELPSHSPVLLSYPTQTPCTSTCKIHHKHLLGPYQAL